jgi:hypothetical protein
MHPKDIDVFYLKTGSLELIDYPAKRATSVCSGKDVLVHEKTPNIVVATVFMIERDGRAHQMRSSNCQDGRKPAT